MLARLALMHLHGLVSGVLEGPVLEGTTRLELACLVHWGDVVLVRGVFVNLDHERILIVGHLLGILFC